MIILFVVFVDGTLYAIVIIRYQNQQWAGIQDFVPDELWSLPPSIGLWKKHIIYVFIFQFIGSAKLFTWRICDSLLLC